MGTYCKRESGFQNSSGSGPPPIPEPDYSMSESEDERDGQRLAKEIDAEEVCSSISAIHIVTETSANSNARYLHSFSTSSAFNEGKISC